MKHAYGLHNLFLISTAGYRYFLVQAAAKHHLPVVIELWQDEDKASAMRWVGLNGNYTGGLDMLLHELDRKVYAMDLGDLHACGKLFTITFCKLSFASSAAKYVNWDDFLNNGFKWLFKLVKNWCIKWKNWTSFETK